MTNYTDITNRFGSAGYLVTSALNDLSVKIADSGDYNRLDEGSDSNATKAIGEYTNARRTIATKRITYLRPLLNTAATIVHNMNVAAKMKASHYTVPALSKEFLNYIDKHPELVSPFGGGVVAPALYETLAREYNHEVDLVNMSLADWADVIKHKIAETHIDAPTGLVSLNLSGRSPVNRTSPPQKGAHCLSLA